MRQYTVSHEQAALSAAAEARRHFTDASVDRILARCEAGSYNYREALDDFLGGIARKQREGRP
jgi:hypothetical protein